MADLNEPADGGYVRVLTWEQLVTTGPIAYVGAFMDRRVSA